MFRVSSKCFLHELAQEAHGSPAFPSLQSMPFIVTVIMLSGEMQQFRIQRGIVAKELKVALGHQFGVKRSQIQLFTSLGQQLQEEASLIELVDFALADVLDPKTLRHLELELSVMVVLRDSVCLVCAAPCSRKCGRCRDAQYCSEPCQKQDWPAHKILCATR